MKTKDKRTERLNIRLTQKELNRIRGLARLYAGGDVTKWVLWAAIDGDRKYLK